MRLAIIPARGGSRRVPRKNARAFAGRPMLAHPVAAARASRSIDRVWVSTDDPEIADVARAAGAEVPFVRPGAIADDHATLAEVMRHALGHAREAGLDVSEACLVFATAPMLDPDDIDRGLAELLRTGADHALSVAPFAFAPQRAQRLGADGTLEYVQPEFARTRSQDLEPLFHDAAQFVWGRAEAFAEPGDAPRTVAVPVDPARVVDIDTPEDWARAERAFASLASRGDGVRAGLARAS